MLQRISVISLTIILMTSCAREEPPSEVVYVRPLSPYYAVKEGDTTSTVAQKHGMDEAELVKINRLKSPYILIPGQRLLIHPKAENQVVPIIPPSDSEVTIKPLGDLEENTGEENQDSSTTIVSGSELSPHVGALAPSESPSSLSAGSANLTQFDWPIRGEIIQNFGQKLPDGSISEGINIRAAANLPVKAIADGVIKNAGALIPAFGNMVVIKHTNGSLSIYAHLKEITVKQPSGKEVVKVVKGQMIGRIGDTGVAKNNHQLYLQIRDKNLKPIDPLTMLP